MLATAVLSVPAAHAGLISGIGNLVAPTCGATSKPFAQFGDYASYYPLPNNGLETGAAGWTLTGGASVVADNEPWMVNGFGRAALSLPPGATATSPAVCINLFDPHFRLFARSVGASGRLNAQVVFRGLTGNVTGVLNFASFDPDAYADWRPSERVPSLLALPALTVSAQLRVTSLASRGSWRIDDVFVDPFVSRIG